jgi:hypothetical protein
MRLYVRCCLLKSSSGRTRINLAVLQPDESFSTYHFGDEIQCPVCGKKLRVDATYTKE